MITTCARGDIRKDFVQSEILIVDQHISNGGETIRSKGAGGGDRREGDGVNVVDVNVESAGVGVMAVVVVAKVRA